MIEPSFIALDWRRLAIGGPVAVVPDVRGPDGAWTGKSLEQALRETTGNAVILVHGVMNNGYEGLQKLRDFARELHRAGHSERFLAIVWPGDHSLISCLPAARETARRLAPLLDRHLGTRVPNVVSHSGGALLTLELVRLTRTLRWNQLVFFAPGVDRVALADPMYKEPASRVGRLTVAWSNADDVLGNADWMPGLDPLGLYGPPPVGDGHPPNLIDQATQPAAASVGQRVRHRDYWPTWIDEATSPSLNPYQHAAAKFALAALRAGAAPEYVPEMHPVWPHPWSEDEAAGEV